MDMDMPMGFPWTLPPPVEFHSSREFTCKLSQEECAYQQGHWRFWYEADHVYALDTVYFCIAIIALFAIGHAIAILATPKIKSTGLWRRANAAVRYVSYRGVHLRGVGWYSPPLGVMLVGLVGVIFFFAMTLGPRPYYWPFDGQSWGDSPPLGTRSGWMSLALLPFVLASASKYNLITLVTGISHEKIQPFHRWGAYVMFVTALVHTFPFIVYDIRSGTMVENWTTSFSYWTGVAALVPQAYMTFFSIKVLRDRFYEFFKATHLLVALMFVLFFFFHCDFTLTSVDYFIAAGVVYFAPFFALQLRTFCEHGLGYRARIEHGRHGQLVVRIPTKPHFVWQPGQHIFLRFLSPKLGLQALSSHPFTICSLPSAHEAVFHVRPHKGITARIATLAQAQNDLSIRVLMDGPYGGMGNQNLAAYDRSIIIAGGSGAGYTLPLIEDYVERRWMPSAHQEQDFQKENSTHSGLTVVLAVRSIAMRSWFLQEVDDLLRRHSSTGRVPHLDVRCHVTRDTQGSVDATSDTTSESDLERIAVTDEKIGASADHPQRTASITPKLGQGRPDLPRLIEEAVNSSDKLGVSVCGPASMMHDVRNVVAKAQTGIMGNGSKDVFLHTEHFEW